MNEDIRKMINKVKNFKQFVNESNFTIFQKVDKPLYKIGDIIKVGFNESHWDRRLTPYLCEILNITKVTGVNFNEYFDYEIKILEPIIDAVNLYNTKRFHKENGEIHNTTEDYILNF